MNTSILGRILMVGNDRSGATWAETWVMPILLELFAFPCAWISIQGLHDKEPWSRILEFATAGIVLGVMGALWIFFRKRVPEFLPWHRLRIAKLELAAALQENSELRNGLDAPKELIALPAPKQGQLVKPQHNVQCVGFKYIECEPFKIAALRFQNVPVPGKLMGKFECPRLRVIFYENSTGQEIADLAPVQWWDDKDGIMDISAEGRDADIASYFEGKWTASETYSDEHTLQPRLHSVDLPAGDIRIIAILSGQHGALPVPQVTGILTLGEDGTASFQRMSD